MAVHLLLLAVACVHAQDTLCIDDPLCGGPPPSCAAPNTIFTVIIKSVPKNKQQNDGCNQATSNLASNGQTNNGASKNIVIAGNNQRLSGVSRPYFYCDMRVYRICLRICMYVSCVCKHIWMFGRRLPTYQRSNFKSMTRAIRTERNLKRCTSSTG